ncbi:MAG: GAF domain-containing protein [Anaerolineales bacterium]|jgi:GAF domain-containing protein|uniref:GAF domain-containing protein n=1 Tax=Candidatus Villigracilis vicinus TaxID=3140679 RepID=UPI0031355930|nr:GAF domain-containing protein [Anaerolineales bacterium]MBK7449826.1 GAF domain-containing protein [Anaerolineales bacterium]
MRNKSIQFSAFDLKTWRERFIRIVLRVASILGVIMISASFSTATNTDRVLFIVMYIILLAITLLPTGYTLRAYLLLIITTIVGVNAVLAWGPWADGSLFLLSTVVMATLLLDNKIDFVLLAGSILFLITLGLLSLNGVFDVRSPQAPPLDLASWGVYIADFSILGIIIISATNMLKSAFTKVVTQMQTAFEALDMERKNLEHKVQERTTELETRMSQLRASALTAGVIAETQEITELLNKAASLISERFEYYHVGIFILDAQRRNVYLQSASSEIGKSLIGRSFHAEPDRKNPLAVVVETNKTLITSDLDRTNFTQDPNFPLTRSRMILPLSVRGTVIGLIDIHSDQPRAFSSEEAEIIQTLADLTAISFDNARLLDETRNLLTQLESNTALQTQRTWSKFTSRHKSAYLYTPAGVRPIFARDKQTNADDLYVPVSLHGQEIGRIKLKKRKGISNEWSERERDLVEKISYQVALALENSRLVDEAQKNALRNQMVANFSTFVRETLNIEEVVRSAATELRKVFDLKEAEILISTLSPQQSEQDS